MGTNRSWAQYPPTYRAHEMSLLADWILSGTSGSVAGLPGVGKSNFLGFLCHRPEVMQALLAAHQINLALIPIDLNNLPDETAATFYRVILRGFYEIQAHFDHTLQQVITAAYQENKAIQDPFVVQSTLRELLGHFQGQKMRVGFVFDRFDDFCEAAPPQTVSALRGLRDSFKDTLFYLMGMRQEAAYLSDPSTLGELYEILDAHVCWLEPMNEDDARWLVAREIHLATSPLLEPDIDTFLKLSGGVPSLLKAICHWWLATPDKPAPEKWGDVLLANPSLDYRLQEILAGLSQEELFILSEVERLAHQNEKTGSWPKLEQQYHQVLDHLVIKGVCQPNKRGWSITSELLASYLAMTKGRGRGRIWLDKDTEELYQGQRRIEDLAPLERELLQFLLRYPRLRHTKTDLIVNAWPDELRKMGVTDDSLYQVIAGLRKKIEPIPARPCYILNWRGKPEGGYQLFPEGRPT